MEEEEELEEVVVVERGALTYVRYMSVNAPPRLYWIGSKSDLKSR
jgi:hypothetical protein